jgi:hypothetical protein
MPTTTQPGSRRFFQRGELLTLVGMAIVVLSASQNWRVETPAVNPALAALVVRKVAHTAYEIPLGALKVGWLVVLCAVTAGSLTLWDVTPASKKVLLPVQCAAGISVAVIALLFAGPQPGIILALLGAAAILAGAIQRYR